MAMALKLGLLLCSDITQAIVIFMNSKHSGPFNLGHSQEITINDLASLIRGKIDLSVPFEYKKLPKMIQLKGGQFVIKLIKFCNGF